MPKYTERKRCCMKLKYTEDGHLELHIENNEDVIDDVMIENINHNPYLLPAFKSIDEKDIIIYYIEELIPLSDYLKKNILTLRESKNIVLHILEAFIKIRDTGLKEENVIPYLNYIYMEPKTQKIKLIYCPVFTTMKFDGVVEVLQEFCISVRTNDSELLLGTLLQYMNNDEIADLEEIKKSIENVEKNISVREVEKVVEKPVERMVEKVIEKTVDNGQNKVMTYTVILFYGVITLGLPYVLSIFLDKTLVTIPGTLNFFLFLLAALANLIYIQYFTKSNCSEKMVITVQKPNDMVDTPLNYEKEKNASAVLYEESKKRKASKKLKASQKKNAFGNDKLEKKSEDIFENTYETTLKDKKEFFENSAFLKKQKKAAYLIQEGKSGIKDRIYLNRDEILLVRDETADLKMNDTVISKKHAKIVYRNNKYYISDLHSSNGTYLNDFRLEPHEEYELKNGNRITFGNLNYFFYL